MIQSVVDESTSIFHTGVGNEGKLVNYSPNLEVNFPLQVHWTMSFWGHHYWPQKNTEWDKIGTFVVYWLNYRIPIYLATILVIIWNLTKHRIVLACYRESPNWSQQCISLDLQLEQITLQKIYQSTICQSC